MKKELSETAKKWLEEYRNKTPINQGKIERNNKFYLKLKEQKRKNYLKSKL